MTATMNTGDVSRRLGVPVTAELLEELGFKPAGKDKRAILWDQGDYHEMAMKVGSFVQSRTDVPMQPKPERKATKSTTVAATDDDEL
jgi:hypothetical protein